MKELVEVIAKALVDHPEEVKVTETEREDAILVELSVAPADMGKVIGKSGKIAKAIRIARKCIRIVYENIWFAIGIKMLCLLLGALGLADMWLAVFADVGVMILAVLNAIRALFVKKL